MIARECNSKRLALTLKLSIRKDIEMLYIWTDHMYFFISFIDLISDADWEEYKSCRDEIWMNNA
jgi:hypothetical protein